MNLDPDSLASNPPLADDEIEELIEAFRYYKHTSLTLNVAYKQLQDNLDKLNRQLEEKNRELTRNISELSKTQVFLGSILDSMDAGVIAVDTAGRITVWNNAAESIIGRSAEEMKEREYGSLDFHGGQSEDLLLLKVLEGADPDSFTRDIVNAQGETIPVRCFASSIRNPDGERIGAVEILNDISEIRKLEARVSMNRTLSALGEMAATVAHELRNPLGGIGGFASILYDMVAENSDEHRYVRKIIEGVESLNKIATNLLTYTRPVVPRFFTTDLRELLQEVLSFVEIEVEQMKSDIELKTRMPRQPVLFEFDNELMRQALLNIYKNSVQVLGQKGGVITTRVSLREKGKVVAIRIHDNGPGIPMNIRSKLFNPFFTTKTRGTGLGLPLVKKNVELHSGHVSYVSEMGQGTEFLIELPAQ